MLNKKFILLGLVAVVLVGACVAPKTPTENTTTSEKISRVTTAPATSTTLSENYLGNSETQEISVKKFSSKVEAIAKNKFSDACLITAFTTSPASSEQRPEKKGKSTSWDYEFYSKSENKHLSISTISAISSEVKVGGIIEIEAPPSDQLRKCIILSDMVDSDEAAKKVPFEMSMSGAITLKDDVYVFLKGLDIVEIDAKTGNVVD